MMGTGYTHDARRVNAEFPYKGCSTIVIAKMKCSNCGAEMSNLSMTWGRRQLWFVLPIMLLSFIPLARILWFKGDVTKELKISDVQKRMNGDFIEIVGLITNTGSHNWSHVAIEAEFFDTAGNFVDEAQEYLKSDVVRGAKEHFKIRVRPSTTEIASENKMELKIAGGHTMPF